MLISKETLQKAFTKEQYNAIVQWMLDNYSIEDGYEPEHIREWSQSYSKHLQQVNQ